MNDIITNCKLKNGKHFRPHAKRHIHIYLLHRKWLSHLGLRLHREKRTQLDWTERKKWIKVKHMLDLERRAATHNKIKEF